MEVVQDAPQTAPAKRTIEEIRKHYTELCNAAGQLQYQIKVQERELEAVVYEMSETNKEAAQAVKELEEAVNGTSENH